VQTGKGSVTGQPKGKLDGFLARLHPERKTKANLPGSTEMFLSEDPSMV